MKKIRLGDLLKEYGYVDENQVEEALDYQKKHHDENLRLGEILIKLGYVTETQMLQALAKRLDLKITDLENIRVDIEAVEKIPKQLAKKYNMFAYGIKDNNLLIATDNPLNLYGVEDIRQVSQMNSVFVLDSKSAIKKAIEKYYSEINTKVALKKASNMAQAVGEFNSEVEDIGNDTPVVAALNQLLLHSYSMKASDIHIEPFEDYLLVRVRVDGVITETARLSSNIKLPLIARIKILANMDIAERRIPQDGHFKTSIEGQSINVRVSTIPTVYGEKAVIRFLFESVSVDQAEHFGMSESNYKKFEEIISSPHGMIYITGPTGSGKTTTLYMVLEKMAKEPVNISTIEDPVERNLNAINQMQVNNQAELTFEAGLRALLRQDPDVIMVGETRDAETANIAVRAAITGHQVFSTLHTNNAISTIVRLEDMGLPAYMVANSLAGLVAQRLMRKICLECGEWHEATSDECQLLGVQSGRIKKGKGCPACNGTGYKGRIAVHEVVVIDKKLRSMISKRAEMDEMEKVLREEKDFVSLRTAAAELVLSGVTTLEEFNKVAHNMD